ncbi:MAG: acetyltransferase [Bacillota bacterium]
MENVVIIGAGDFSKLIIDILTARNKVNKEYNILGLIDDNKKVDEEINGYRILGDFNWIDNNADKDFKVICSVAEPETKRKLIERSLKRDLEFINAIHPDTTISDFCEISSKGVIINAGVIIAANVILEPYTLVNFNSTVGHDVILRKYASVMPGVNLAGFVELKEGAYIGMNSALIQNVSVGEYSTIGAGAVVVKDIPDDVTAVGIPAKVVKRNN